jgi:alkylation response protein AidB-like acyl-CoA dehydrogenase
MRPTRSDDTVIEGAFVPDNYVFRSRAPGFAGADGYILLLFVWAEPLFASVYLGIAQRAFDLAVGSVKQKTSVANLARTMAYHPEIQHTLAEMMFELERMVPHLERITADWVNGVGLRRDVARQSGRTQVRLR